VKRREEDEQERRRREQRQSSSGRQGLVTSANGEDVEKSVSKEKDRSKGFDLYA
jgi:hypothetical protein